MACGAGERPTAKWSAVRTSTPAWRSAAANWPARQGSGRGSQMSGYSASVRNSKPCKMCNADLRRSWVSWRCCAISASIAPLSSQRVATSGSRGATIQLSARMLAANLLSHSGAAST